MQERIWSAINGIGENDAIQCRPANHSLAVLIFSSQAADVQSDIAVSNKTQQPIFARPHLTFFQH
jgi:hypothetical protein